MKRCLVTGATGFVAGHVIPLLEKHGYEVVGCSNQESKWPFCDITNLEEVDLLVEDTKPTHCLHLAGFSDVGKSWDNPDVVMNVNAQGTKNLLDAIANHAPDCRVVAISSAMVYGRPQYNPVNELHPLDPVSPYAKSKVKMESYCEVFLSSGLNIAYPRSFNHMGPGQMRGFVLADFASQVARVEKGLQDEIKVGNLDAQRDFLDVRDVADAYLRLLESDVVGPVNVCSGNAIPVKSLLEGLCKLANADVPIVEDPSKMRPSDVPLMVGSAKFLIEKTSWNPKYDLDMTLRDTLNYWRRISDE
jgi:GDP-4-dehydro-6-deoxy-D-mannose reductase